MFVKSRSDKEAPPLVAPFVLQIAAENIHILQHVMAIPDGDIMEAVVRILKSRHKFGRHEKQFCEWMGPLCAGCDNNV